ncbi:PAS domain-containing protein [Pedobacter sp. L105]|uniref:PAS domain-containing sensor histidine kinase n=1 Tax=Pedobacter sp. L105 TaxID=1641871 RepID=UPI00131B5479|nr:PAS domain-containing protein [Pedobacter sp. L105]
MENKVLEILKHMNDHSEEVIFIFDPYNFVFLYFNDALEYIAKIKKDSCIQDPHKLLDIVHQEDLDYIRESLKYLLTRTGSSLLNFRIIRPDQTERWIRAKIYPIIEEGKVRYLSGSAEDDTMRKNSIFNMQRINGWKNSTLEILSHDLRGPLGTVKMLASIISNRLPEPDDHEIRKLSTMIIDLANRNMELIQSLLKREILETAEVQLSKERLNVVWEVHEVLDVYIKAQAEIKKTIRLTYSHDKIYAEIDSMQFVQILNNLVSNAIKFTPENGEVKIHIEKLEESFLVTVSDNGIGIPKSLQPVLFNKYTTAGRDAIDGQSPVGLGMWIVKLLTEAHDGRIWFESEEGKGSTFYVELPKGKYILED